MLLGAASFRKLFITLTAIVSFLSVSHVHANGLGRFLPQLGGVPTLPQNSGDYAMINVNDVMIPLSNLNESTISPRVARVLRSLGFKSIARSSFEDLLKQTQDDTTFIQIENFGRAYDLLNEDKASQAKLLKEFVVQLKAKGNSLAVPSADTLRLLVLDDKAVDLETLDQLKWGAEANDEELLLMAASLERYLTASYGDDTSLAPETRLTRIALDQVTQNLFNQIAIHSTFYRNQFMVQATSFLTSVAYWTTWHTHSGFMVGLGVEFGSFIHAGLHLLSPGQLKQFFELVKITGGNIGRYASSKIMRKDEDVILDITLKELPESVKDELAATGGSIATAKKLTGFKQFEEGLEKLFSNMGNQSQKEYIVDITVSSLRNLAEDHGIKDKGVISASAVTDGLNGLSYFSSLIVPWPLALSLDGTTSSLVYKFWKDSIKDLESLQKIRGLIGLEGIDSEKTKTTSYRIQAWLRSLIPTRPEVITSLPKFEVKSKNSHLDVTKANRSSSDEATIEQHKGAVDNRELETEKEAAE